MSFDIGDRVIDRDDDSPSAAEVVDLPGTTADEHTIAAMGKTVAQVNPEYPADVPVVGIQFVRGDEPAGNTYHYPASRLRAVSAEWEPPAAKSDAQREREETIERYEKQFTAYRCAIERLVENPAAAAEYLEREYDPTIRPNTRGECAASREDEYRSSVAGAIACWRCNDGGRRPRKLMADDPVPSDAPCHTYEARDPSYALKIWFWEEVVVGNEDRSLTEDVAKSLTPNSEFDRLRWTARDLTHDDERYRRSAVVRIAYEATIGGLLDEDYNHSRALAYLRDLGVDTNELLPGGDPHVGTGRGESR